MQLTSPISSDLIVAGFHALSEPLRIRILELLRGRELCVCDLCTALGATQSKLSFHLKTLKEAGLVNSRQQGRWIYYSLNFSQLSVLEEYLAEYSSQSQISQRLCEDCCEEYDLESIEDERKRTTISLVQRPGQAQFRQQLLNVYNCQCQITGCNVEEVLEAAHIVPYYGVRSDQISNGLLLRTDLHKLFDSHLLTVEPEKMRVYIAPSLRSTCYGDLDNRLLYLPKDEAHRPSRDALRKHYNQCEWIKVLKESDTTKDILI